MLIVAPAGCRRERITGPRREEVKGGWLELAYSKAYPRMVPLDAPACEIVRHHMAQGSRETAPGFFVCQGPGPVPVPGAHCRRNPRARLTETVTVAKNILDVGSANPRHRDPSSPVRSVDRWGRAGRETALAECPATRCNRHNIQCWWLLEIPAINLRLLDLPGFDTDNDSVFMNKTVRDYCRDAGVEFTRCRP